MNARDAGKLRDGFATLLAGPLIWFLFFLVAYAITGATCEYAGGASTNIRLLVGTLALVTLALIAVLGTRAIIRFRHAQAGAGDDIARRRFVDLVGGALCAASIVGVIWLTAGVFVHPLC